MLTIRQLRTLYTDELKVKHLSSDNREVFASIVTTVFREFENVVDCNDKGQVTPTFCFSNQCLSLSLSGRNLVRH